MPCDVPAPGYTYVLERFDQSGAAFRQACAETGDQTQPCGDLLSYVARRSDGRTRILCAQHAARFAARHGLAFPVVQCPT
jgi:hypothetical protein